MTDTIARRSIWTLIGVDLCARISYAMARTPVLPLYAAFLGAGPALIGFVGAAATITGIFLKLPAGALSDVTGRRPLLYVGLFVFGSGPFLYLLAPGTWTLVGVRFYHGLATAIYSPVAMATVASLAAGRRGEYLSWLSNSKILGKLLGAFLGGVILSLALVEWDSLRDLFSLQTIEAAFRSVPLAPEDLTSADFGRVYLVCGGFGLAAVLLGLTVIRDVGPASSGATGGPSEVWKKFKAGLREVLGDMRVLIASGSEGVQNLTVGIVEHFLPIYAVFVAGHSPLEAGLLYGGQILTTIAAKPALGRWSDRRGRRGVICAGMILCALPFAAIPWVAGFGGLLALALLFGLGEALVTSSSAALVGDLCRRRSLGAAMGVFGTIKDVGHALGPILGGLLIAGFAGGGAGGAALAYQESPAPYRIAFGVVAVILLVYAALFARATRE